MFLVCITMPIFLVIASANASEDVLSKSRQANDRASEIREYINEKEKSILDRDAISRDLLQGSAKTNPQKNSKWTMAAGCSYCLNDNFDQENSILWRKSDWRNNGDVFLNI